VLARLYVFAPVHELGHVVFGLMTGVPAFVTGWRETSFDGTPTILFILGGYLFEILFFGWLSTKRGRFGLWPIWVGALVNAYRFSSKSYDLHVLTAVWYPGGDWRIRGAWYVVAGVLVAFFVIRALVPHKSAKTKGKRVDKPGGDLLLSNRLIENSRRYR
jgi:hypothetical protein